MPPVGREIPRFISGSLLTRRLIHTTTRFEARPKLATDPSLSKKLKGGILPASMTTQKLQRGAANARNKAQENTAIAQTVRDTSQLAAVDVSKSEGLVLRKASKSLQHTGVVHPFPERRSRSANRNAGSVGSVPSGTATSENDTFKVRRVQTTALAASLPVIRGAGRVMPHVYDTVEALRLHRRDAAQNGYLVGFVPTMGALHQGHLDLMRQAAIDCNEVWVSIYVNPTQFGANEDLSTYPSTWEADLEKIQNLNDELLAKRQGRVSSIFRPRSPEILYPYGIEGTSHVIINPELTQILEGSSRKTFFRGVTTVVMKLLNIVQPDRVYFGQKDIQQFAVIKRMIKEFHMPVSIERVATTREPSGLAMSSRNAYLGRRRRRAATLLFEMLSAAKTMFESMPPRERNRETLIDAAMKVYNDTKAAHDTRAISEPSTAVQFSLDYLSLADPDNLQEIQSEIGPRGAIMSLAVYFHPLQPGTIEANEELGINNDSTTVRLIDNELLGVDEGRGLEHS